jgi:hypothetical protein
VRLVDLPDRKLKGCALYPPPILKTNLSSQ